MINPYKLVVFDWEGTVSDTLGLILNTVASEAKLLGFGDIDYQQARKYVDLGLEPALRKIFPDLSPVQHEHLMQAVQLALISRPSEVILNPGVREFIEKLIAANIDIAIATNKGPNSLQRALQATDLESVFKVTRSAGQIPAKPHPQMLEEIMEHFGHAPAATVMIGDSTSDMEMAKSVNATAIGVDFYHQQESSLKEAGAIVVFDDYQLVADFLGLPKN